MEELSSYREGKEQNLKNPKCSLGTRESRKAKVKVSDGHEIARQHQTGKREGGEGSGASASVAHLEELEGLEEVEVQFEPDGKRVVVPSGTSLVRCASLAGISIETPCGGVGICGKCRVRLERPEDNPPVGAEMRLLSPSELAEGIRLACRHSVCQPITVFVLESSRSLIAQILSRGKERWMPVSPAVRRCSLLLPRPSLHDQRCDVERLFDGLTEALCVPKQGWQIPWQVLRQLPEALRKDNFHLTVVLRGNTIIAVEAGRVEKPLYGIAFDVGTTTVVGYLLNLSTGQELAVASRLNPQVAYGDDVISRLVHALEHRGGRKQLQVGIVKVMNEIIAEAAQVARIPLTEIFEATVVGNTAMLHFLLNVDPRPLAFAPFVSTFTDSVEVEASQLGLRVCPTATVTTLPIIGGFVGADTVGMVLAYMHMADTDAEGETVLAMDIGTNGEVVLRHKGKYWACSAAAGPAFEGARIRQGMRGAPGAISSVRLNETVEYLTINDMPARGICGSGLIDAVAQMLDAQIVDEAGRMRSAEELDFLSDGLKERLIQNSEQEREFVLVPANESALGVAIGLTQKDIRELQLAKGSIRAALNTLLKTAGVSHEEVCVIYLSGAFGNYINKESALRIGLLPPLPLERIQSVGNAAGVGAKLALLSVEERRRAIQIAHQIEHVELSVNPYYHEELMETILFPRGCY